MNDDQPREPRFWLAKWAGQESFWRDVASQTFASIIFAVVVALLAAVVGFIPWLRVIQWFLVIAGFALAFMGAIPFGFKARWPAWAWLTYVFVTFFGIGWGALLWIGATGGFHG